MKKEEKNKILEGIREGIEKNIVAIGVDIRFLEREKIRAKEGDLANLQNSINNSKTLKETFERKLEVVEDELAGK